MEATLDQEEAAMLLAFRRKKAAALASTKDKDTGAAGVPQPGGTQDSFVRLCLSGDLDQVREFLASPSPKFDIDAPAADGFTGLITAAREGHADLVRALVSDYSAAISLPKGKCDHTALRGCFFSLHIQHLFCNASIYVFAWFKLPP